MGPTQRENEILSQKNAYISCTMLCCDRVFSTMMNLKQHMMYHAGIMPFMCSECGLAFKTQVGIDKHFETNHGGESVNNSKVLWNIFLFSLSFYNFTIFLFSRSWEVSQFAMCAVPEFPSKRRRITLNFTFQFRVSKFTQKREQLAEVIFHQHFNFSQSTFWIFLIQLIFCCIWNQPRPANEQMKECLTTAPL